VLLQGRILYIFSTSRGVGENFTVTKLVEVNFSVARLICVNFALLGVVVLFLFMVS
jgi:hypothetical protein